MIKSAIEFVPFSNKQRKILSWWCPDSPVHNSLGIIADGSIRSGKTVPMSISFIIWACDTFNDQNFMLCGKTIGSLRRNVTNWLKPVLEDQRYTVQESLGDNVIVIKRNDKVNYFHLFGGRDESSQDLVQGFTSAGALFDEVTLMPESFVNQATGRCSVPKSKIWFNCNPAAPAHWFKKKWLDDRVNKNLVHIHFTMDDNPSLSPEKKAMYQSLYTGVFHKRAILGKWVLAEGAIFDMWDDSKNVYDEPCPEWRVTDSVRDIAIDYGTQNPMVFLDVIDDGETVWVDDEYYYCGRTTGVQKTDSQYGDDLDEFCQGKDIRYIVIDPSASSFIAELKGRGYRIREADNEVYDGIRRVCTLIGRRIIMVNERCTNVIEEIQSYVWDTKATDKGTEKPIKQNDHGPDALRYWCKTIFKMRRIGELDFPYAA